MWPASLATSQGRPCATTSPPPLPPSGPMSINQSALVIRSRSCSTTTTLCPAATNRCSTAMMRCTSAICSPTVGSSNTYKVCGAFCPRLPTSSRTLASSVTSFKRCASPPLSVGEACPSSKYPRPTSCKSCSGWAMAGMVAKNSTASSTSIFSTAPTDLPRHCTAKVCGLKRAPLHTSQGTLTSGKKLMATVRMPWPSQAGQRPAPVLKLKREAV